MTSTVENEDTGGNVVSSKPKNLRKWSEENYLKHKTEADNFANPYYKNIELIVKRPPYRRFINPSQVYELNDIAKTKPYDKNNYDDNDFNLTRAKYYAYITKNNYYYLKWQEMFPGALTARKRPGRPRKTDAVGEVNNNNNNKKPKTIKKQEEETVDDKIVVLTDDDEVEEETKIPEKKPVSVAALKIKANKINLEELEEDDESDSSESEKEQPVVKKADDSQETMKQATKMMKVIGEVRLEIEQFFEDWNKKRTRWQSMICESVFDVPS